MTPPSTLRPDVSDDRLLSAFAGAAVGVGFLALYLTTGLLFAQWSVAAFLEHLTVETVFWLLAASLAIIAVVAVPVFLFRQSGLVSPLALLTIVLFGWVAAGLSIGAVFGLSLYVFGLTPLYLVLYVLLGGGEIYLRNRTNREEQPPESGRKTR